jgi:hypothetical protein
MSGLGFSRVAGGGFKFLAGKGALAKGMGLLGPAFVGYGMYRGYQEGGVGGALWGGAKELALWGAFSAGGKALSVAFQGTAIKGFAGGALRFAKHPLVLAAAGAAIGGYYAVKGLTKLGRESRESEFVGSMEAFHTEGAVAMARAHVGQGGSLQRAGYTLRHRALQEINRSHTNARTLLGNEASLMHLR